MRKFATEETYLRELLNNQEAACKNTSDTIIYNELKKTLGSAIAHLPPQQKKVYQLGKVEGKKYDEIALILNISKETVKEHMTKANTTIKQFISQKAGLISLLISSIAYLQKTNM